MQETTVNRSPKAEYQIFRTGTSWVTMDHNPLESVDLNVDHLIPRLLAAAEGYPQSAVHARDQRLKREINYFGDRALSSDLYTEVRSDELACEADANARNCKSTSGTMGARSHGEPERQPNMERACLEDFQARIPEISVSVFNPLVKPRSAFSEFRCQPEQLTQSNCSKTPLEESRVKLISKDSGEATSPINQRPESSKPSPQGQLSMASCSRDFVSPGDGHVYFQNRTVSPAWSNQSNLPPDWPSLSCHSARLQSGVDKCTCNTTQYHPHLCSTVQVRIDVRTPCHPCHRCLPSQPRGGRSPFLDFHQVGNVGPVKPRLDAANRTQYRVLGYPNNSVAKDSKGMNYARKDRDDHFSSPSQHSSAFLLDAPHNPLVKNEKLFAAGNRNCMTPNWQEKSAHTSLTELKATQHMPFLEDVASFIPWLENEQNPAQSGPFQNAPIDGVMDGSQNCNGDRMALSHPLLDNKLKTSCHENPAPDSLSSLLIHPSNSGPLQSVQVGRHQHGSNGSPIQSLSNFVANILPQEAQKAGQIRPTQNTGTHKVNKYRLSTRSNYRTQITSKTDRHLCISHDHNMQKRCRTGLEVFQE